VKIHGR